MQGNGDARDDTVLPGNCQRKSPASRVRRECSTRAGFLRLAAGVVDRVVHADDILVRFTTVSDNTCGVQYKSEVNGATWLTLPGTVTGTGGIATYTDVGAAGLPRRFYRLFERAP
jgi:hypothetical protein